MGRQKFITVYSDGGSVNNGKRDPTKPVYGAYCALIVNKENEIQKKFIKVFSDVTNNQMEVLGPYQALIYLEKYYLKNLKPKKQCLKITLISDSQYFIKGCSEWMKNWKRRGWRNSEGKKIPNLELWQEVDKLLNRNPGIEYDFLWVNGHSGKNVSVEEDRDIYFNELCDTLLSEELAEYR